MFGILVWFFCGATTSVLLVLSALVGQRWRYVKRHKLLLFAAFCFGPLSWMVALMLGLISLTIVRIGNNGGFQEK